MNINAIKSTLNKMLGELTERAEVIDEELSQPGDNDWEENATESENDEVMEKVGTLAAAEIRQIKLALARIESGTYGRCTESQSMIAECRLRALPFATKCIACLKKAES